MYAYIHIHKRGLPLDWREEQHGRKCCSNRINAILYISYLNVNSLWTLNQRVERLLSQGCSSHLIVLSFLLPTTFDYLYQEHPTFPPDQKQYMQYIIWLFGKINLYFIFIPLQGVLSELVFLFPVTFFFSCVLWITTKFHYGGKF